MTVECLLAGGAAGSAIFVAGDARSMARRRLTHAPKDVRRATTHGQGVLIVALAGLLVACLVWGLATCLAATGPMVVLGARRWLRDRATQRRELSALSAQLPRVADLLAACLDAGAAPADALDAVRRELAGPVSTRLAPVAGALRAGLDPLAVYGEFEVGDPVRALVRVMARAMESGAPLAAMVSMVADDERRRRRWAAEAAARRAGVQAVGPLVVCFLPAFVLLGVVPVVVGIAAEVLGDLA